MKNAKGLKTKEKIILSAIDLFSKKGVHWVSFQQIADRVGISQPALYKHFQDKDELIQACALLAAESGRAIIDKHINPYGSAKEQIFQYIEGNFIWLRDHPKEGSIILALYYFGFNNPPIQKLMIAINNQSVERLSLRLSSGIHEKLWSLNDIRGMARMIHDLLLGEMIKAIHTPEEIELTNRVSLVWKTVERLLLSPTETLAN